MYVAARRARFNGISGPVNIPRGTRLEQQGRYIYHEGQQLCTVKSKAAHDFLAPDDDGQGLERGRLIAAIRSTLERKDADHQKRWDRIWGALLCKRYQRQDHPDFWLWNQAFYEAPISDLQSIARLVGAVTVKRKETT